MRAGSKLPSRAGAVEGEKPREVEKCRCLADPAPRKRGEGQDSGLGRQPDSGSSRIRRAIPRPLHPRSYRRQKKPICSPPPILLYCSGCLETGVETWDFGTR